MTSKRRKRWIATIESECPEWINSVTAVRVENDLFALPIKTIDYAYAVFASNGHVRFTIHTINGHRAEKYIAELSRRAVGAAERYEQKMRAHFKRYKRVFREGYSLPGPPTPELRCLYDSAAKSERRPTNPNGKTLRCGFSGGEFHWRKWPLSNVDILINHAGVKRD